MLVDDRVPRLQERALVVLIKLGYVGYATIYDLVTRELNGLDIFLCNKLIEFEEI